MRAVSRIKELISSGVLRRAITLAWATAPYIRPAKVWNLLRCEIEKRRRAARPRSLPYVAIIDISNACNLRCPYCPTGERRKSGRKRGIVDPLKVQRLIDEIGSYLISANLFNWGEPLLHPEIGAIVEMFHKARIFTMISTNLNTRKKELLNGVCEAGLDYMVVSLGGMSQSVYEQYHRNGSIDRVIENTRHIAEYKRKRSLKKPIIEWKYLAFRHNMHEVEAARRLSRELGVDIFRYVRAGGPEEALVECNQAPERDVPVNLCHQLWHVILLNADGGISPCCYLFFKEDDFAEYARDSLRKTRSNWRFVFARKLFDASALDELPWDLRHPCLKCSLVHEQPHLQAYLKLNPHAKKGHRTGGP
ncbi:MAG: radical SAM protein [Deltaproteobacteria bacterium]|nr:radical SAM protein [Deltaproteobacteria bacterium]